MQYSLRRARMPPRMPRMAEVSIAAGRNAFRSQFLADPSQLQTMALTVVT